MDTLPDSLLLKILTHLDDSADVARCRVASKAFNTVFPDLRSIHLHCSLKWYLNLTSRVSFNTVFLRLISKLKVVESVRVTIGDFDESLSVHGDDIVNGDFCLTDGDFAMEWLPRVSDSLKSLALLDYSRHSRPSNILSLISAYCRNLVDLEIRGTWLSMDNLNQMPMLTHLTLSSTKLEDYHLNEFNKCFPNLESLQLFFVEGLIDPKIHLLNLENFACVGDYGSPSLTLNAPHLTRLALFGLEFIALHLEAPMLSSLLLSLDVSGHAGAFTFTAKKFENLTTVSLDSSFVGSILSEFPITKTVKNLRLDSRSQAPGDRKMTLRKVFTTFPNVSSLDLNPLAWSELEECLNPEGWDILDGKKGLETICVRLKLVDPSLTFSSLSYLLDECIGLSDVTLVIHEEVADSISKSFMSKCMARWPRLEWKWGTWGDKRNMMS